MAVSEYNRQLLNAVDAYQPAGPPSSPAAPGVAPMIAAILALRGLLPWGAYQEAQKALVGAAHSEFAASCWNHAVAIALATP